MTSIKAVLGSQKWQGVPPDLWLLSRVCNVEKVVEESLSVDAMLLPSGQGFIIALNKDQSPERQRFSWAHELAHVMLSNGSCSQIRSRTKATRRTHTGQDEERACERLAAEILMPKIMFRRWATRAGWTLSSIPKLANLFKTSLTATAIRLVELAPEPCLLTLWRPCREGGFLLRPAWNTQSSPCGISKLFLNFPMDKLAFWPIYKAFGVQELVTGTVSLGSRVHGSLTYQKARCEASGFGRGQNRKVLSLTYLRRGTLPII